MYTEYNYTYMSTIFIQFYTKYYYKIYTLIQERILNIITHI